MYAIVSIAGQQFKVAKDQQIFVHRLQGDEGASIEFDNVLLAENEGSFKLGSDLKSAKVSARRDLRALETSFVASLPRSVRLRRGASWYN